MEVSGKPHALATVPMGKDPLNRRLGGHHSWSGCLGCLGIEPSIIQLIA